MQNQNHHNLTQKNVNVVLVEVVPEKNPIKRGLQKSQKAEKPNSQWRKEPLKNDNHPILFIDIQQYIYKSLSTGVEPATFRLTAECSNQLS